jgi:hypothetical protein
MGVVGVDSRILTGSLPVSKLRRPRLFETAFSRYTATEQVGQGGTGTIFKASDVLERSLRSS